jgi:hypothetical protein
MLPSKRLDGATSLQKQFKLFEIWVSRNMFIVKIFKIKKPSAKLENYN